jgi:hypothetical protein
MLAPHLGDPPSGLIDQSFLEGAMSDVTTAPPFAATVRTPRLGWPPPGLEPVQGEAWPIIVEFCIGVTLLALPLLFAVATPQQFWSLGAFGQSWWVPMATTLLAFLILLSVSWRLSRLLRAAAAATRLGYGIGTIAIVATDHGKDSGFVLQGARHFAHVEPGKRRELLALRITGAACYLAAALWIPLGLALAVLFAQSGSMGIAAMWILTLAPAAALIVAATIARVAERFVMRRIQKSAPADVMDDVQREATEWTENLDIVADEASLGSRLRAKPRALSAAAFVVVVPAVLLILPVAAVITSAAMGPVVAMMAVPRYTRMMEKVAVANAMRGYRLPFDSSITPAAAGIAFDNLSHVGRPKLFPLGKPPVVNYPAWPKAPKDWDITSGANGSIFERIQKGLKPEERDYLAQLAAHPSHAEYAIVGHAAHADLLGARLVMPLPDTLNAFDLPIPSFGRTRESAYAHVARAAFEFSQGRNADAERTIKEVVSAGYLMMDESTSLIEALIGAVIEDIGTFNLERFYRATGRIADADALKATRDAAQQAAEFAHIAEPEYRISGSSLKAITDLVSNPQLPRGMRWEYFMTFNNLAPCLNLQNVVLGPGAEYDAWVAGTRATLVRYPSEAELFTILNAGLLGTRANPAHGCLPSTRTLKLLKSFS